MEASPHPAVSRLNGWKEIAAHFGRTVRTVQRWERELGLPVHRLSTGKGESVYALAGELDRWLAENERAPAATASLQDNGSGREGSGTPAASRLTVSSINPALALLASGVLIAIAALALYMATRAPAPRLASPHGVPASYKREGPLLTILDREGRELWHYRSPAALAETSYAHERRLAAPVLFADLEGDGRVEVIFNASSASLGRSAVHVFEQDGRPRFTWRYEGKKRFGDMTYAAPWQVHEVIVRRPAAGNPELWVSFRHVPWFPSAVVRLDPHGRIVREFWHHGYIETFIPAKVGRRDVLLVGGGNNEFRAGFLAAIDPESSATAPTLRPEYTCADCPVGQPLRYLLFPKLDLSREFDAVPGVRVIAVDAAGQVVASVEHVGVLPAAGTAPQGGAQSHYVLDPDLNPISAELAQSYVQAHRALEVAGRLTRPLGKEDEAELWPVLEWDGKGFRAAKR